MIQELPDISFERNMNHNYLILKKCDFFEMSKDNTTDFRIRMILENSIPGLLPVSYRMVNGESRYYYEINSLQSLDRLYEKKEIKYDELKALILGCIKLFDTLEEYLLDGTQIIINKEFIYINVENMEPFFVCYPDYTGDVRMSFMEFIDDIMTRIDHTDQRAVMLGYQIYRYTRNPNYVLSEIYDMINKTIYDINKNDYYPKKDKVVEKNLEEYYDKECNYQNKLVRNMIKTDSGISLNSDIKLKNEIYENGNKSNKIMDNKESDELRLSNRILDYEDTNEKDSDYSDLQKSSSIGDLIGTIICIFIALSGVAIIVGARILMLFKLNGNQELYLYGAIAMAMVAAILFSSCYIKKKRYEKELENLQSEDSDEYEIMDYRKEFNKDKELNVQKKSLDDYNFDNIKAGNTNYKENKNYRKFNYDSNETICLDSNIIEERILRGKMNGKDISISLEQLPVTIGKLANFVDYVINDNTVSKIHARFEEYDGRVYLCDLNSTNGTVKNGELIDINNPVPLEPGDKLRFGRTCFTYC